MGPFHRPRPNPTHQITDPTQPKPLPGEFMDPRPNTTHTQLNPRTHEDAVMCQTANFHKAELLPPSAKLHYVVMYTTSVFRKYAISDP